MHQRIDELLGIVADAVLVGKRPALFAREIRSAERISRGDCKLPREVDNAAALHDVLKRRS